MVLIAAQIGIGKHLPQQNALGDEADARLRGGDLVEPDLVADFVAEPHAALLRHARREHPRRQPARLQHDDLAFLREAVIEQNLRHLRRFARARRRLQDQPRLAFQRLQEWLLEFEDGKITPVHGMQKIEELRRSDGKRKCADRCVVLSRRMTLA